MSMPELYDDAELLLLTGYAQAHKQEEWLRDKGIPHRREGRRVIVSRLHVRSWLEGRDMIVSEGPNWGALNQPLPRRAHA